MKLVHVSDTHLGHRRWGLPEREIDLYDSFSEVVDIAIREGAEIILHGGDMFDRPDPPPQTYIRVYRELSRLRDHGISFFVVAGNHDLPSTMKSSPLEFFGSIGLMNVLSINTDGSRTFTSREGFEVEILGYSKRVSNRFFEGGYAQKNDLRRDIIRIALVHSLTCDPFKTFYGWSDNICRERGLRSLSDLGERAGMFRYIALGDFHMPWEGRIRSTPACYPGSIEALDRGEAFNDAGEFIERSIYVVKIDPDGVDLRRVKLERTRRWIYIEGSDYKDLISKIRSIQWSAFKKPPIAVFLLKKTPTTLERESVTRELNALIESKKIFRYDLIVEESSREGTRIIASSGSSESIEVPSIENVLKDILKDHELADLLSRFIDENIGGKDLLNTLISRRDLLDKLYNMIKDLR
ncbi:MAG: exonuclease SbcCD subunit D [Sulfolobales archaeon]